MFVSCDIKTFSHKRTAGLARRHRVGWFNPSQWEAPMAEAAVSLSPNRETQRMLRHRSAVMTLARMRAKKAVLLALRAQGLKPQDFSAREIGVLTDYYVISIGRSSWLRQRRPLLHGRGLRSGAVQNSTQTHKRRMSPNQSLRLCRCQVHNDYRLRPAYQRMAKHSMLNKLRCVRLVAPGCLPRK
jgi:hypothetical protein